MAEQPSKQRISGKGWTGLYYDGRPGWNSRKPRYQEYLEKEKWDTVISICAANRDYGERVPSISANNYAELELKVDEYGK